MVAIPIDANSKDNDAARRLLQIAILRRLRFFESRGPAQLFRDERTFPTTPFNAAKSKLISAHISSYANHNRLEDDTHEYVLDG